MIVLAWVALGIGTSQPTAPADSLLERRLARVAQYLGADRSIRGRELEDLTSAAKRYQDRGVDSASRVAAGLQLARRMLAATGRDSAVADSLLRRTVATGVRGNFPAGAELDGRATTPGALPDLRVDGSGPIALILIPEYRKTHDIYQPFIERHRERFTMYSFSLPGYGGTEPYPFPERADYGRRTWLDGVAHGVVQLIRDRQIERPVLVGSMDAGTYIATRAASLSPGSVRGVMILNGGLRDEAIAVPPSFEGGRESDREAAVTGDLDVFMFLVFARPARSAEATAQAMLGPIAPTNPIRYYTKDTVWVRRIYGMHLGFRPFMERYYLEWLTADLSGWVARLEVPMLVIHGIADADAPQHGDRSIERQWQTFLARHPDRRIEVVPFEEVRGLIAIDAPDRLGLAIERFVNGAAK